MRQKDRQQLYFGAEAVQSSVHRWNVRHYHRSMLSQRNLVGQYVQTGGKTACIYYWRGSRERNSLLEYVFESRAGKTVCAHVYYCVPASGTVAGPPNTLEASNGDVQECDAALGRAEGHSML